MDVSMQNLTSILLRNNKTLTDKIKIIVTINFILTFIKLKLIKSWPVSVS